MLRFFAFSLSFSLLVSCTTPAETSDKPLPLMPPTGVADAAEFVAIFNKTCLANYPNDKAVGRAFKTLGFVEEDVQRSDYDPVYRQFTLSRNDITAGVGSLKLTWHGAEAWGTEIVRRCTVQAELSNPEAIDSLLSNLAVQSDEVFELRQSKTSPRRSSGIFTNSSGSFRLTFDNSQSIRGLVRGEPQEECGGFERCRTWGQTRLEVAPVDPPAKLNSS